MTASNLHGTKRGYAAHIRDGDEPCTPCRAANTDIVQANKILLGKTQSVRVPIGVLGTALLQLDESSLDAVSEAIGPEVTAACMEVAGWEAMRRGAEA